MSARKWTYWYYVTEVNKESNTTYKEKTCVGFSSKMESPLHTYDDDNKGFTWSAKIEFIVKLPYQLEEKEPKKAWEELQSALIKKGLRSKDGTI